MLGVRDGRWGCCTEKRALLWLQEARELSNWDRSLPSLKMWLERQSGILFAAFQIWL